MSRGSGISSLPTTLHAIAINNYITDTGKFLKYDSVLGIKTTSLFEDTNGKLGIGTITPLSLLHSAGTIGLTSAINNNGARPALSQVPIVGEIHAFGGGNTPDIGLDDGFLRLSAGGGTNLNVKSYIDIAGYSNQSDVLNSIVFGTNGKERFRIQQNFSNNTNTVNTTNQPKIAFQQFQYDNSGANYNAIDGYDTTYGSLNWIMTSTPWLFGNQVRFAYKGDNTFLPNARSITNMQQVGSTSPSNGGLQIDGKSVIFTGTNGGFVGSYNGIVIDKSNIFAYDYGGGGSQDLYIQSVGGRISVGGMTPTQYFSVTGRGVAGSIEPIGLSLVSKYNNGNVHNWALYTANEAGGFGVTPNGFDIWEYPDTMKRFGISPGGNVAIGAITPAYKLDVDGTIKGRHGLYVYETVAAGNGGYVGAFQHPQTVNTGHGMAVYMKGDGTVCGTILLNADNNTVAYNTSSDARLKTNAESFDGLDLVMRMKPKQYNRIREDGNINPTKEIGFYAQELYNVFPDGVSKGSDANPNEEGFNPWVVEYGRSTPVLVRAIQQQQMQIDELKRIISTRDITN